MFIKWSSQPFKALPDRLVISVSQLDIYRYIAHQTLAHSKEADYLWEPNSKCMKKVFILFLVGSLSSVMIRCGKTDKHDHSDAQTQEEDSSQALYDEVMKLHDEGMARMDELHRLKEDLKNRIESAPELVEEKRRDIEAKIAKLDSAGRSMMTWMRNFHPETDSLDEQAYQQYLESEMERVKKVKDDILDAIARAKEE